MSSNNSNNPHAWLGLLKWSLSYTDGTASNDKEKAPPTPLSDSDRVFLENVMKDGIIDESKRIHEILNLFITYLENKVSSSSTTTDNNKSENNSNDITDDDTMIDLLWELRDLIGLIDYSKVFVTMGGLPFLIGCISQRSVNNDIRGICLVLLATLCQNNPSVQNATLGLKLPISNENNENVIDRLLRLYKLEQEEVDRLTRLYEIEPEEEDRRLYEQEEKDRRIMQARIIQAISCITRGNAKAEENICLNDTFVKIIQRAFLPNTNESLFKRSLFLLQALLCSDTSSYTRVQKFDLCIQMVILSFITGESYSLEVREMSLQLINAILQQKVNVRTIYSYKTKLIDIGTAIINKKDSLDDEEEIERLSYECDLWKDIMDALNTLNDEIVDAIDNTNVDTVQEENIVEEQHQSSNLMLGSPPTHDTFAQ